MSVPAWAPEPEALLVKLWADKVPAGDIAMQILRTYGQAYTRNAVIGKAHRMGLPKRGRSFKATNGDPKPERMHPIKLPKATKPPALKINPQNHTIAPAPSQPMAPEPVRVEPPIGQRCSLIELEDDKCHWPIGDPHTPDFFFCGGKAVTGLPYCGYHCAIAFVPKRS